MTPKIYNYARVSSTKQLKGVGLETQQQRSVLDALSKNYDLPVHDENFVDEGLSAFHGKHREGALGTVLARIESGDIASESILVVFSLDRLSRETVNIAMEQLLSIINKGVRVYTHIDNKMFDAKGQNLTADLITSLIIMQRANEESLTKSKRTIAAMKEALKQWKKDGKHRGALGRSPFWIDQTTNTFNQNAEGVKAAIDLYLKGYGSLRIKKHLDEHYSYKRIRTSKVKQEATWDYVAINQVWTKRSLIGEKHLMIEDVKYVLPDYYPALIDVETFQRLQKLKKSKSGRATSKGNIHLLKGILRCGKCGSMLNLIDKGDGNISYVCNLSAKGENKHTRELFNCQMLELVTLEVCRDKFLKEANKGQTFKKEIANIEDEINTEETKLVELLARFKKKARKTILDLIEDTEDKIESLNNKLNEIQARTFEDKFDLLEDVYTNEVRKDLLHPERAEIRNNLLSVLSTVTVNRREEKSEFSKTGMVNCVDITLSFKNGKKRKIWVEPFKYLKSGEKTLLTPIHYAFDNEGNDTNGSPLLISSLIKKLYDADLLKTLYPSKGRYRWSEIDHNIGSFLYLPVGMDLESMTELYPDYHGKSNNDIKPHSLQDLALLLKKVNNISNEDLKWASEHKCVVYNTFQTL